MKVTKRAMQQLAKQAIKHFKNSNSIEVLPQ